MSFPLVGSLKKPIAVTVNNNIMRNVVRITGNDEWGYVYEYMSDKGKRLRTIEPYWHNDKVKHKRNDLPALGTIVRLRFDNNPHKIIAYVGHGYYQMTNLQGIKSTNHFYSMVWNK